MFYFYFFFFCIFYLLRINRTINQADPINIGFGTVSRDNSSILLCYIIVCTKMGIMYLKKKLGLMRFGMFVTEDIIMII